MADVKWIKIATNIFDNQKIKIIESMPEGDAIIVIWFKLLMAAGNVNDGGSVYFTQDIPYTDQMLSTVFNKPLTTIQLALNTFEKFGMIEVIDDIIQVSNWEKYQNIEGLDKIREQNRLRKQRQREREKALIESCHVTVTGSHATEEDIDIDKDKEVDIDNTPPKSPKGNAVFKTMVDDTELSEPLKNILYEWLDYKKEIKKPYKSERGFQQFINMVAKYSLTYSDDEIITVINKSMASGYQGVVWDWLEKGKKTNSYVDAINNRMSAVDDWLKDMESRR